MPKKKSERRPNLLATLVALCFLAGCSGSQDEEPASPAPASEVTEPASAPGVGATDDIEPRPEPETATPAAANEETSWKIAVFAGVNGEFGSFGEGSLTEDPEGNPVALAIEYDLDGLPSRVVMRNDRVYLGTGDGNMRWLDVTDQVGQVSPVASTLLQEEQDGFVQLREQNYGNETFRIFGKLGEIVALGDGAAMGSRLLYWEDDAGVVRRHVSIVSLRADGNTATIITVSDRDDGSTLPDWYGRASINARFNAMPAAPALRYGMGMAQPQANWLEQPDSSLLEATLDLIVPPANAQFVGILSDVLGDLRDDVIDDLTGATVDDFIDNMPAPGSDLSEFMRQFAQSGYRAIKNYFTDDQIRELGRSAIRNIFKKVVERGLLQIAPYLGYYGLAPILADAIIEDVIDWLFSDTHGEPHIGMFDGRRYSFQAAGEFVYFQTPEFEVQQRFLGEPGRATSAQATAVRIGEHVIESYFEPVSGRPADMTIIIDGEETVLDSEGVSFPNGGYVGRQQSLSQYHNLIAVAPGGSYVIIENLNVSQNVLFGITGQTQQQIRGGLGGVPDGNGANDFTLRDGSILSAEDAMSIDGLYGRFAASWRVQSDERLFSRGDAAEFLTSEYTDLPTSVARLEDFTSEEREAARQTCVAAGVIGDEALNDCSYDVLVTGNPEWANDSGSSRVVGRLATPDDLATQSVAGLSTDELRGFDAPDAAPAGSILSFTWRGPGAEDDSIFLAATSLADNRYPRRNRFEVSDGPEASVVAPVEPGDYEIRYFSDANGTVLFRRPITITEPAVEITAPAEISAGAPLPVAWTGEALPDDDGLLITEPGMEDNRRWMGDRFYRLENGSPAALVAPAEPGAYEIRYFSDANATVLFRQALTVTEADVEITAPSEINAGEPLPVAWTGTPLADGDGLFIATPDMDANRRWMGDRFYAVEDGSPADLVAPAEPGSYEIRVYSRANGQPLLRQALTVLPPDVTMDLPDAVAAGSEFEVAWSGPAADGDFLFVAPPDLDDNRYYTRGVHRADEGTPARLNAPAEPGTYEVRYYSRRNGDVLARQTLTVR